MTQRRAVLTLLACAVPMPSSAADPRAQRIGYLVPTPLVDPPSRERAAFLDELQRLGRAVGRELSIVYRSAENEPEFLDDLARELVASKVDVIVAAGTEPALAAARSTRSIPIVFIGVPDPVAIGLVSSLARPGANITGMSWESERLLGKRLELLKEALPRSRRLALLWNPSHPETERSRAMLPPLARRFGLDVSEHPAESAADLGRAFGAIERARADALYVLTDPRLVASRQIVAEQALRLRLPSFYGYQGWVAAGGLMSYAADLSALFRRAAHHVDRILRGARAGDLPVEQPTKFELVINLRTAKALGLTMPPALLLRADEVVE